MPQELSTKMMEPLVDKSEVRPFDKVTVYATGYKNFHKVGEPLELHPLLAAKFVEAGKATKDKPDEKTIAKAQKEADEKAAKEKADIAAAAKILGEQQNK